MSGGTFAGFAWECSCGNVEYGEESPEECQSCGRLNSFVQLPEEIVEAREREIMEESLIEDVPIKKRALTKKIASLKSKKLLAKKTRGKK